MLDSYFLLICLQYSPFLIMIHISYYLILILHMILWSWLFLLIEIHDSRSDIDSYWFLIVNNDNYSCSWLNIMFVKVESRKNVIFLINLIIIVFKWTQYLKLFSGLNKLWIGYQSVDFPWFIFYLSISYIQRRSIIWMKPFTM